MPTARMRKKLPAYPFYEKLGFSALEGVHEGMLHGEPRPMFLAIGVVAPALEG